jgi:hypothetical protein
LPLTPSNILTVPELDPEFVLIVISPVPSVVRTASVLVSPILTVSADNTTSPVPLGCKVILPFEVDVIENVLTSKAPPNCGVVSCTTSVIPPEVIAT